MKVYTLPIVVKASNKEEAFKNSIQILETLYPAEDGYSCHQSFPVDIQEEIAKLEFLPKESSRKS